VTVNRDAIRRGARLLHEGGVVAFPTETVYGLGADASNPQAVRRVYAIKGRPFGRPLTVHIAAADQIECFAESISEHARRLAEALWPGPLTLVLAKRAHVLHDLTGGSDTVGLRVPDHPVAVGLISELSHLRDEVAGIAAPSANRFDEPPATTAQTVTQALGDAPDMVMEGGACALGIPSTVVDCSTRNPKILRPGAVSEQRIAEILGILENGALPNRPGGR
jgi:L-threonylcarbamoyladenylate synthase